MPFFRFHFTDPAQLLPVSREMTEELQRAIGCPREHIVLETIHSDVMNEGKLQAGAWPFIEVDYFERPRDVQDRVAKIVTAALRKAGYPECDIYFRYLQAENYYENGECFQK